MVTASETFLSNPSSPLHSDFVDLFLSDAVQIRSHLVFLRKRKGLFRNDDCLSRAARISCNVQLKVSKSAFSVAYIRRKGTEHAECALL